MDRNVLLTTGARAVNLVVSLTTSAITARVLGPAGRGEYFLAMTVAGTIVQFANIGLASSNTYQVARQPSVLGRLTGNSLAIAAAGGLAGGFVAAGLTGLDWWAGGGKAVLWAAALAPLSLFFLFGGNLLVGLGRFVEYNLFDISSRLMVLVSMIVAALWLPTAPGFLALSVFVSLVVTLALYLRLRHHAGARVSTDRALLSEGYHFAWRAYLVTTLGFLCLRSGTFLLWYTTTPEQVGQFSIASQVGDGLLLFPTSAAMVLFPSLVRRQGDSWAATRRMLVQTVPPYAVLCLLAAVLIRPLVDIVYGSEYRSAVPVFWALMPGIFMLGVVSILSQILAASRFPLGIFLAWTAGLVTTLAVAWVAIPHQGALGAAWSVTAGHAVVLVLAVLAIARLPRRPTEANVNSAVALESGTFVAPGGMQ